MTDAPFVVGAYAIVLMGLVGYAVTLRRRLSGARRIVAAVEDERGPDSTEVLP
jgi:hypothetical protein